MDYKIQTIFHNTSCVVSDYFTYSIIICRCVFITRYVTFRTSQNLTKEKIIHTTWKVHVVHLTPDENDIKNERKKTKTNECV
jgi:hypothetical protein